MFACSSAFGGIKEDARTTIINLEAKETCAPWIDVIGPATVQRSDIRSCDAGLAHGALCLVDVEPLQLIVRHVEDGRAGVVVRMFLQFNNEPYSSAKHSTRLTHSTTPKYQ